MSGYVFHREEEEFINTKPWLRRKLSRAKGDLNNKNEKRLHGPTRLDQNIH
jgi:hypothetical protein